MSTTEIVSLPLPSDGLAARLALIEEAEATLDLQYYEWQRDAVGSLLLDRVISAADRGVTVRLLVDDLHLRDRTRSAASLCVHPNLEVRVFNPWTRRSNVLTQAVEFVVRFSELDRRMHNKLMVADRQRAVVGGRNIADEHFGLRAAFNLVDHDVWVAGEAASRLGDVFETYWSSPPAVVATELHSAVSTADLEAVRAQIGDRAARRAGTVPADLVDGGAWRDRVASTSVPVASDALHVTFDRPGASSEIGPTQVIEALRRAVESARRELVVVTPFFVPDEMDIAFYGSLVDRGVSIRLLTNSLASNSGTISNSGLAARRRSLLDAGVALYELRPDAADKPDWEIASNVGGYLGLHAKLYTIDGERVFLGSVNLDPRSKFINTEIGLLVDDASFTGDTVAGIERLMTPDNAWHVELDSDGELVWSSAAGVTHRQPARGWTQRALDSLYRALPVDRYI